LSSVVIKSVDEALVRRSMDGYAARLFAAHPEIAEIIVFGSFAEGNYAPGSDLDILIVLERADRPVRDRIPLYLPGPFPVGVDLFPYTRDEIAALTDSPVIAATRRSRWRYARA
jgi:predicted nucleotidyltransferase